MAEFDRLYNNYKRLMFGIAYDILKNEQDAEDAVQDAFFKIADNLDRIADADSPQARNFAAVVTRNICFNMLRKRHIETDIDGTDVSSDMSAEDEFLSAQGVETLERALESLPEKYRDILYLTAYEELSLREAAKLLGITYENAKSRVKRARKKVSEFLKEVSYE
ncbi:MAG: sigma-70 family RNA polymerase sigma factor [Oscillospiraceae bacterium]|nr:sigma-70 family RNA polymerase sigma factor [Oscillospiraceae bacterium]